MSRPDLSIFNPVYMDIFRFLQTYPVKIISCGLFSHFTTPPQDFMVLAAMNAGQPAEEIHTE